MSNAPIIAWSAESGHRLATTSEVASVLKDEALYPETRGGWSILPGGTMARRLSCSDPLDMRAVWYYAALALGAAHEDARRTALVAVRLGATILGWGLTCPRFHSFRDLGSRLPACWWGDATTEEAATEALCTAVWGTK